MHNETRHENMLEIPISDELYITSDDRNFIIAKKRTNKKGMEYYEGQRFFSRVEHLIDELVEYKLMVSNAKTLEQILENQYKIKSEIIEAFKKIN